MEKDIDYYLICIKDSYVKKIMISGLDFFVSLTDNEEEACQFFDEAEADDINRYYCADQGEVLYYEAEKPESWYDEDDDEDDWEEEE